MLSDCGGCFCNEILCLYCGCFYHYYGLADPDEVAFASNIALQGIFDEHRFSLYRNRQAMHRITGYIGLLLFDNFKLPGYFEGRHGMTKDDMDKCIVYFRESIEPAALQSCNPSVDRDWLLKLCNCR